MKLTERVFENEYVRLEPLHELHREPLREAANADREIWTSLYPYSMAGEHFDPFWVRIQNDHSIGSWIPFAVIVSGQCVGLTCYIRPEAAHRSVDIGSTYYRPEFRGGVVNPAAKHLLLGNAFACGANRVQFGVDALNARSRAAMTKLGAIEEGVLRRARIAWTGRVFDRVIFSVLVDEWPRVRETLEQQLSVRRGRSYDSCALAHVLVGEPDPTSPGHALIGAQQERFRYREAERLGGFEIHD